jgi:hypothetical protein
VSGVSGALEPDTCSSKLLDGFQSRRNRPEPDFLRGDYAEFIGMFEVEEQIDGSPSTADGHRFPSNHC